jgi:hypothetical protein
VLRVQGARQRIGDHAAAPNRGLSVDAIERRARSHLDAESFQRARDGRPRFLAEARRNHIGALDQDDPVSPGELGRQFEPGEAAADHRDCCAGRQRLEASIERQRAVVAADVERALDAGH